MLVDGWRGASVLVAHENDVMLWIPDDMRNRHRSYVADMEAEGFTIPAWGGAQSLNAIDFASATLNASSLVASSVTYGVTVDNGGITPYIGTVVGSGWGVFGALAQTPGAATYDRCEATLSNQGVNFGDVRHVALEVYLPFSDPLYPWPDNPFPQWNYLFQCPQGDLASALPIAFGVRVSGGNPILELRRGNDAESVREWSIQLNGGGAEFYYNRTFHALISFRLHPIFGYLRAQIYRPWDGKTITSPEYHGPLGFTGGDDKCSVKFGLYRGSQDAKPGQNANPGYYTGFKKVRMANTASLARTW